MESAFARFNYSFNRRYLITGTYRADASSNFGPNNKWGYFPSFSAAWVVSEEPFMKPIEGVLNWLKIRGGYGEVGNQNITAYAYGQSLRAITTVYGTAFSPLNIANPDVKWESTTSTNVGIELGFLQSRIRLNADFYIKKSKDFLYQLPMPDYYGAMSVPDQNGFQSPYVNLGEMENKGVDLSLNTVNIKNAGGFSWTSDVVFSTYKNELTKLADENAAIFQIIEFNQTITKTAVGGPVGQFFGYKTDGIFQSVEEIENAPQHGDGTIDETNGTWIGDIRFQDIDGPDGVPDGIVDDYDRTYIGNPHPDFTFSFSNQFSYKNFDLNVSLYGSYGNDVYNWNRVQTEGMGDIYGNPSANVANRFREGVNTDTDIPRFVFSDPSNNVRVSDRFIEDGSFLRIQNITLGYTLPASILEKTKVISSLRAYLTVQNLYTFTDYSGYDPAIGTETNATGNNALLMGIDNGRYPVPRTYMLGISLNF
jgi:TonB-linked SusC/RagA family outer membrane protein